MGGEVPAVRRRSSRCHTATCVEVAVGDCHVQVRDSKNRSGPKLTFTHAEWAAFIGGVHDGEFDD